MTSSLNLAELPASIAIIQIPRTAAFTGLKLNAHETGQHLHSCNYEVD